MKIPHWLRLITISVSVLACATIWRAAFAMTHTIPQEMAGLTGTAVLVVLSVMALAMIGSWTPTQKSWRRWRRVHEYPHGPVSASVLTNEWQVSEPAEDRIIQSLRRQVCALRRENDQLHYILQEKNAKLLQDPLTGIANRVAYEERIQQECKRWCRFGTPLALLVWDIDHFKQVNDQHGHAMGDVILRKVAQQLATRLRGTDMVARFGGEEFVMLLPGADPLAALLLADQIRLAVASAHGNGTAGIPVTISCGLTVFQRGDTPESAFLRADSALYMAKNAGRNCCMAG